MEKWKLRVAEKNIVRLHVDAIVNSADAEYPGRFGLDREIHDSAGPRLYNVTQTLKGKPSGFVKLTLGYQLPAKYILHTIVPTFASSHPKLMSALLAASYANCLALAKLRGFRQVAFPVLGSGLCGFPFNMAATVALTEIDRFLQNDTTLEEVTVTIYDSRGYDLSLLANSILGHYMDDFDTPSVNR